MERLVQNYIALQYCYHLTVYFMRMMINDDDDTTIIQNLHDGPSLQMGLLYSINTERTSCECLAIELVGNEDETAAPSVCTVYSIVGVM